MHRRYYKYTVLDKLHDRIVVVNGSASECAFAMGISLHSFYSAHAKCMGEGHKRWEITRLNSH